jgi:hypothetical protein
MQCYISGKRNPYSFELKDENLYSLTCNHGHNTNLLLQNPKYEILFEIGTQAIADGYYREAI